MYNIIFILFILNLSSSYKYPFSLAKYSSSYFLSRENNEVPSNNPEQNEQVTHIDLDLQKIVSEMDRLKISSLGNIPKPPQSKDEIQHDSFEGYLLEHFESIVKKDSSYVNFQEFYNWRKKIGTVLTKDEMYEFYTLMAGENEECDIMNFIYINRLIDENDGAFYD